MTIEEELKTAYANLRGHQERSLDYIRTIDRLQEEIQVLEERVRGLSNESQRHHLQD